MVLRRDLRVKYIQKSKNSKVANDKLSQGTQGLNTFLPGGHAAGTDHVTASITGYYGNVNQTTALQDVTRNRVAGIL